MSETYYRKVGNKYEAVSYYDSNVIDAVPKDTAVLIINKGNSTLTKYNVDIAIAPLLAGCEYLQEQMATNLHLASKVSVPLAMTEAENKAWNNLIAIGGESFKRLSYPSSQECIESGMNVLKDKLSHVLADPTCKDAYEKFKVCVKLKLETDNIV